VPVQSVQPVRVKESLAKDKKSSSVKKRNNENEVPVRVQKKRSKQEKEVDSMRKALSDCTSAVLNKPVDCSVCEAGLDEPKIRNAPYIKCTIFGKEIEALIDTGAQITILKRSRMDLPVAKLRMKSATSHKAILYGPVWTKIEIKGEPYPFPVYEADIGENLIGYDFLEFFDVRIRAKGRYIKIGSEQKVPFTVKKSPTKGKFNDGKLYYVVRANQRMLLRPFTNRQLETKLDADLKADELDGASAWLSQGDEVDKEQGLVTVQSTSKSGVVTNDTSPVVDVTMKDQEKVDLGSKSKIQPEEAKQLGKHPLRTGLFT